MFTTTKQNRIILVALTVTMILVITIPYAAFAAPANNEPIQGTRTLYGKGVARENVNNENVTIPANFTLSLQRASTNSTIPKFDVASGTINVNGMVYTITSGTGGVLRGRHIIMLQAIGTESNGQAVTLKLAGRYFWMGGHTFVLRMAGSLQTSNDRELLLMRAAIKV